MKKLFILLAIAILSASAANAEEKTVTYDFGDISSIDANFMYNIQVTKGKSDKVTLVYDDAIETFVDIDVKYSNGMLSLGRKKRDKKSESKFGSWISKSNKGRITVYLEMDEISSIKVSGAAKISFTGTFKAEDLSIDIHGASSLNDLQVNGESLDIDCSGASKVAVSGNFSKSIDIDISGASSMTFSGNSNRLKADMSGASSFRYNGNADVCGIACSGASKATLKGKGSDAEYNCSGASSIDAEDFTAKDATVELSGASSLSVYASGDLHYDVNSASKMTYFGDPVLHNNSKSSNVVKGR